MSGHLDPGIVDDLREKLVTHYVGGGWRAPLATGGNPVRLACGRCPGQIVPAGPLDVERALLHARAFAVSGAGAAAGAAVAERIMQDSGALEATLERAQRAECGAAGRSLAEGALQHLVADRRPVALLFPADLMPRAQLLLVESVLRSGRPLIIKPAPGGAVAATVLFDALHALGVSPGAVALLQGDGPGTGGLLLRHPDLETLRILSRDK